MNDIPYKVRVIVPIKVKDEQFNQIQNLIEAKKKLLYNKQKKFRSILKQNSFLEAVKNDYEAYNEYILQQKRDQIRALEILGEYIKDLTISGHLTDRNIEDAKVEHVKILKELDSIKRNLSSIINDTHDLLNDE